MRPPPTTLVDVQVLRMMDELGPRDLGLSEKHITSTLAESLSVPISVAGRDSKTFEMAIFLLPAGARLPLHDHPDSKSAFCQAVMGYEIR